MALTSKTLKHQLTSLVYEGFLQKESRFLKSWRKRWFVLTQNFLFTFKQQQQYENPTETVPLYTIVNLGKCDEETHRQFSFKIQTSQASFYVSADSNSARQKWIGYIGSSILKSRQRLKPQETE